MRGLEYSLCNGTKVGGGPKQSSVGIKARYLRDLLSPNPITRRFHTRQKLKNTACAISDYTMNKSKINPSESKTLATSIIIKD
jgi:hypothetical protein